MNEGLSLIVPFLAGLALGAIFFSSLWWSVKKVVSSTHPIFWFVSLLLLRMSVTLAGFYWATSGQWKRLVACLAGFILARTIIMHFVGVSWRQPTVSKPEANHASHS